jgi:hypothetical protein
LGREEEEEMSEQNKLGKLRKSLAKWTHEELARSQQDTTPFAAQVTESNGYLSPEQIKEQETNGLYMPSQRIDKNEWNRSGTDDLVKTILGPMARTWKDKTTGRISIGLEKGDKKMIIGAGDSYRSAFETVFINPQKAIEQLNSEHPGWEKQIDIMKKAQENAGK